MPNYKTAEPRQGVFKLPILRAALRSSGVSFPLPAPGPLYSLQGEANGVSQPLSENIAVRHFRALVRHADFSLMWQMSVSGIAVLLGSNKAGSIPQ